MRPASADYLEALKVEELAADLREKGYETILDAQVGDAVFDLIAVRGQERIAFEVKARSRLSNSTEQVAHLREIAVDAGITEFKVVVVTPPHEVAVSIEDLE